MFFFLGVVIGIVLVISALYWFFVMNTTVVTKMYNSSASAGDFWTITSDSVAKTIAYKNTTSGATGLVTFTVNADGTYDVTDTTGNITGALEIPGYQIVLTATKAGPNNNTPALITGITAGPTGVSSTSSANYNYMQFRVNNGGFDAGYVHMVNGAITHGGFSPSQQNPIDQPQTVNLLPSGAVLNPTYIQVVDNTSTPPETVTIFGSANGFLTVDQSNGTIVCMLQSASAAFDASFAKTYTGLFYGKPTASTNNNNSETGTVSMGKCSIVVTAAALVTVTNLTTKATMFSGTIAPISANTSIVGAGLVTDNCNGLFLCTSGSQQFLISFHAQTALFASYTALTNPNYGYFYGSALSAN